MFKENDELQREVDELFSQRKILSLQYLELNKAIVANECEQEMLYKEGLTLIPILDDKNPPSLEEFVTNEQKNPTLTPEKLFELKRIYTRYEELIIENAEKRKMQDINNVEYDKIAKAILIVENKVRFGTEFVENHMHLFTREEMQLFAKENVTNEHTVERLIQSIHEKKKEKPSWKLVSVKQCYKFTFVHENSFEVCHL